MPSTQHQRAQQGVATILEQVLPAEDVVAVELMLLLDPANWNRHLTPDVFVARGVGALDPVYGEPRLQYRIWDEGRAPDLIYEGASPSTFGRDSVGKKEDYAALGVREHVQFDPTGGLLSPRLQVYRLSRSGRYERVPAEVDGTVRCVTLPRYNWIISGCLLRLCDRVAGALVPTPSERAEAEAARADEEAARAEVAEAENARLRAELARLRAEPPLDDHQPPPAPEAAGGRGSGRG
ncbi:MAG TPA: Uma2 family endonuclease [Chloroflexota bacterium]|nr:Uma2 family endonuclease [Chloroflexota bacterium]